VLNQKKEISRKEKKRRGPLDEKKSKSSKGSRGDEERSTFWVSGEKERKKTEPNTKTLSEKKKNTVGEIEVRRPKGVWHGGGRKCFRLRKSVQVEEIKEELTRRKK